MENKQQEIRDIAVKIKKTMEELMYDPKKETRPLTDIEDMAQDIIDLIEEE